MKVCTSFLFDIFPRLNRRNSGNKNVFDSVSKWCKKFLVVQALGTDEFDYFNNELYYAFGLQGLTIKFLFVD
jgi:hypothetical protein